MKDTRKRTREPQEVEGESLPNLSDDATSPVRFTYVVCRKHHAKARQKIQRTSQTSRALAELGLATPPMPDSLDLSPTTIDTLSVLYSESAVAKIWGVAQRALDKVRGLNNGKINWQGGPDMSS